MPTIHQNPSKIQQHYQPQMDCFTTIFTKKQKSFSQNETTYPRYCLFMYGQFFKRDTLFVPLHFVVGHIL